MRNKSEPTASSICIRNSVKGCGGGGAGKEKEKRKKKKKERKKTKAYSAPLERKPREEQEELINEKNGRGGKEKAGWEDQASREKKGKERKICLCTSTIDEERFIKR